MGDADHQIEYRGITGFPFYRVGDDGSVWGQRHGRWVLSYWKRLRLLKDGPEPSLYRKVMLYSDTGFRQVGVHVLVLETFVGTRPEGMQACHNNGNPADNRLGNLRWDTPKGNCADKLIHGTDSRGEKHGMSKLGVDEVRLIRRLFENGQTQPELAARFGVTHGNIHCIVRRKSWAHVEHANNCHATADAIADDRHQNTGG